MKTFLKVILPSAILILLGIMYWRSLAKDAEPARLTAEAETLRRTVVTPHLEAPLEAGKNVLWCGTFQLAWNELCALVGEDLHFAGGDPPIVGTLNRKQFARSDVDEASYVAIADFVRNNVHEKIRRALKAKFGNAASPRLIPARELTPRPQDIVAYTYLQKNLEFGVPFERLEEPIVFAGTSLPAFGMGRETKPDHTKMYPQVAILFYQGPDDFAVELKTKTEGDKLLLAKVKPAGTLGGTIAAVQGRLSKAEAQEATYGDVLAVPKFNFDVTRRFDELVGKQLTVKNPQVAPDLVILSAAQNIRFELNEKGVKLRSESHIAIGCSAAPRPKNPRRMILDKPFLVLLQRAGAKAPYFALWVDNPEILAR